MAGATQARGGGVMRGETRWERGQGPGWKGLKPATEVRL